MWSAGVCLYVLLVGRMPFVAAETPVLFDLIRVGKYELPYTLPSTALDCLSRMLCVDPAARWDVPQLLTHPWVLGMEGSTYSRLASRHVFDGDSVPMLTTSRSCPDMHAAFGPRSSIHNASGTPVRIGQSTPNLHVARETMGKKKASHWGSSRRCRTPCRR